jgi:C4-dicarboxylate-specific signal transduction histidine kinase
VLDALWQRSLTALATKTDAQKSPLDVNHAVNEAIVLVRRGLLSHRVSLRMELSPALPVVRADRTQLQQVIINLVMNGIDAMRQVTDRPRELVIQSHQVEAHYVQVTVKDSGVGISGPRTGCSTPSSPPKPVAWAWALIRDKGSR